MNIGSNRTFRKMKWQSRDEVKSLDLSGVKELGVTSGASTPESFFRDAISLLRRK